MKAETAPAAQQYLAELLREQRAASLRPPPKLRVSEWADAKLRISGKYSPEPGQWSSDRYPYQRGMLDAACDAAVSRIVFMTGSQVGKTSILDAILGYFMDQHPSPTLVVFPSLALGEAYSKDRLSAFIAESPALAAKVSRKRSRDSGNTILHKEFPGGQLTIAGANSAASLASRPIRVVLLDEVDSFPPDADGQGDPADLAIQRTARFEHTRLVVFAGTPTTKEVSRLEKEWLASDQRRWFVPCGSCGEHQYLKWSQVHWTNQDPETAHYACEHCGAAWDDAARLAAVRAGEWRATAPFTGTAGFHVWEAYAAQRLAPLVAEWRKKHKHRESRKTFVNLRLGELWQGEGEGVEWMSLRNRAEDYLVVGDEGFVLPEEVLFLVAGVDTQNDRLEAEILGFGRGEECWPVGYLTFEGDPIEERVWADLDRDVLNRMYPHPAGVDLVIQKMAVDTGGQRTQAAYNYCRTRAPRVMAVKGSNQAARPIIAGRPTPQDVSYRGETIPNGVLLWSIGTDTAKGELYARFGLEDPGPLYFHLASRFTDDYFEQLVSEKLVTRYAKGVPRLEWVLPPGKRNEALDCTVYGYAAAVLIGLQRMNWDELEAAIRAAGERVRAAGPATPSSQAVQPRRPKRQLPRSDWMSRGRVR